MKKILVKQAMTKNIVDPQILQNLRLCRRQQVRAKRTADRSHRNDNTSGISTRELASLQARLFDWSWTLANANRSRQYRK